jgi:hypothetical protein
MLLPGVFSAERCGTTGVEKGPSVDAVSVARCATMDSVGVERHTVMGAEEGATVGTERCATLGLKKSATLGVERSAAVGAE